MSLPIPGQELPVNRWVNPFSLLYAVPNQKPTEVIDLMRQCGFDILINEPPQPPPKPYNPYRELAVAILLQAIHDSFYATNRKDRAEAICWLLYDNDWFPQWCNIVDLNPVEVRQLLSTKFDKGWSNPARIGRPSKEERTYVVH